MILKIMVVDDDNLNCETMGKQLKEAGYIVQTHDNTSAALSSLRANTWHIVIADLKMPDMNGIEFLKAVKANSPDTEVLIMTAYGSIETAVEAMRLGAVDYITKPFRFSELEIRLKKQSELLCQRYRLKEYEEIAKKTGAFHGMIGPSAVMQEVFEKVRIFGPNPASVLITGETGTGKELVARAIHTESGRGPFVVVPCSALPQNIVESELFGHEKGAFTGAIQQRRGHFERANGGSIFLDDVDDLPMDVQPKLLRVLQGSQFERVGGEHSVNVDVRIIAATKKTLYIAVQEKKFRDDLYYRLKVLTITLPSLRTRKEDIVPLATYVLLNIAKRSNGEPKVLSPKAVECLLHYDWPGNVRELQATIESAVALTPGKEISAESLQIIFSGIARHSSMFHISFENLKQMNFNELLSQFEKEVISWALTRANGNQQKAAALLGIPRTTLQNKIKNSNL